MDRKGRFFPFAVLFLPLLLLAFLSGCQSNDPLLEGVPEFEVRKLSFAPAGEKIFQGKGMQKSYLMRWNILGPVPGAGKDVTKEVLEGENLLCGSVEAPGDAYWHVRIFSSRQRADEKHVGLCNWTKTLSAYKGKSLFYGCGTLLADKKYENVTLFLLTSGETVLFLNGEKIGTLPVPNYPGGKEYTVKGLTLNKGANRFVLKYLDKGENPSLRAVSVRFTQEEKEGREMNFSLIR